MMPKLIIFLMEQRIWRNHLEFNAWPFPGQIKAFGQTQQTVVNFNWVPSFFMTDFGIEDLGPVATSHVH